MSLVFVLDLDDGSFVFFREAKAFAGQFSPSEICCLVSVYQGQSTSSCQRLVGLVQNAFECSYRMTWLASISLQLGQCSHHGEHHMEANSPHLTTHPSFLC